MFYNKHMSDNAHPHPVAACSNKKISRFNFYLFFLYFFLHLPQSQLSQQSEFTGFQMKSSLFHTHTRYKILAFRGHTRCNRSVYSVQKLKYFYHIYPNTSKQAIEQVIIHCATSGFILHVKKKYQIYVASPLILGFVIVDDDQLRAKNAANRMGNLISCTTVQHSYSCHEIIFMMFVWVCVRCARFVVQNK